MPTLPSPPAFGLNAHIHLPPNFSAFDTVAQAVELARAQNVRVLGASNYYDYRVYREFSDRAREAGVYPLFGLEVIALLEDLQQAGIKINDPGNPGKLYLCGKGLARLDPMTAEATALLNEIRDSDSARMARMTQRLSEVFLSAGLDLGLDEAAIKARIVQRHGSPEETVYLQERHLAQAFQEVLFEQVPEGERGPVLERLFGTASKNPNDAVGVQNEIRSHLMKAGRPAYERETFVGFDHAYRLVLALGGIPCYPTLADGANPICAFEEPVEELIAGIRARGIYAAELIPLRNRPEVLSQYVLGMRKAGLVVTAGTEHNTLDLSPLEPVCLGGSPIPEELQAIFWEGACVVAAHQHRVSHGEPGFVDETGRLNPDYTSDEERIRAFAAIGEELITQQVTARASS